MLDRTRFRLPCAAFLVLTALAACGRGDAPAPAPAATPEAGGQPRQAASPLPTLDALQIQSPDPGWPRSESEKRIAEARVALEQRPDASEARAALAGEL